MSRYDAKKPFDVEKARTKLEHLIESGKVFDLIEKKPKRSIPQNSYMHLIFSWFALETGYTEAEVKQDIFKKEVNPDIFYEGETGTLVKLERWRSTASLTTSEMTLAIDRFRNYSSQQAGIYLPEPTDLASLQEIENQIENHKQYL